MLRTSASTLHVDNGGEETRQSCEQATETRRPASRDKLVRKALRANNGEIQNQSQCIVLSMNP